MKAIARKASVVKPALDQSHNPKNRYAWIRAGAIAVHKRTGNRYLIDAIALDKTHDRKAIVYRACNGDGTVFVRDYNEFASKFHADSQLAMALQ